MPRTLRWLGFCRAGSAIGFRAIGGSFAFEKHQVGNSEQNRNHARQEKRAAPAAGVDQKTGQQCRAGHAHVAEDPVDRERYAGTLAPVHDHGEADRMINRRKNSDQRQADTNLQRRIGKAGQDRTQTDADEKYDHHAGPAPLVGDPAGEDRTDTEGDESRGGIRDQLRVTQVPFAGQAQRRHRGEDEHEQMIEEMPQIEIQKIDLAALHYVTRVIDPGAILLKNLSAYSLKNAKKCRKHAIRSNP